MKRFILPICMFSLLLACTEKAAQQEASVELLAEIPNTPNLNWLLAEWIRVDEEEGNTTYETWSKANDTTYIGWGYTIAAADTVFEEHMKLRKKGDHWQLEVKMPEEENATLFKMSQHTASSFTVENPTHDFPKQIKYFTAADTLKAIITGGEQNIGFDFVKQQ